MILGMVSIRKVIYITFSFYVLILSTMPCCVEDDCGDEIEVVHVSEHDRDRKPDDCSSCSRFLTCGSCAGFVLSDSGSFSADFAIESLVHTPFFLPVNDYVVRIWQPPNLG